LVPGRDRQTGRITTANMRYAMLALARKKMQKKTSQSLRNTYYVQEHK